MKAGQNLPKETNHQSYLLRLWRNGPAEPWRASLCNALTGEQFHFADPVQVFSFLQEQMTGSLSEDRRETL